MDQGPIAALKKRYVSAFLLAAMERDETVDIKTFLEKWNLLQTSLALGTAWSQITEDTLKNSWKNLLKAHTAATTSTSEPSIDPVLIDPPVDPEVLQTWVEEDLPTSDELIVGALSAKIKTNHCSFKNTFLND